MKLQNKEIEYVLDRKRVVLIRDQHKKLLDRPQNTRNSIINNWLFDNPVLDGATRFEPFERVIEELKLTNKGEM